MKKIISVLLCVSLFLPLLSCGNGEEASKEENSSSAESSEIAQNSESENTREEVSTVDDGKFIIASDGVILTDVVVSQNASQKEKAAANDLRRYIEKMCGSKPKLIRDDKAEAGKKYILVGESEFTKSMGIEKPTGYPGVEKVIVKQEGNYLAILGNDDGNYNGTQFAVNMFLESLGCGWFGQGELWEIVPEHKTLDVTAISIEHTPLCSSRITRAYNTDYDVCDKWYYGGDYSLTGHWLFQVIPASQYSSHPEWFALTNGSRDPSKYGTYFQYCYSNDSFASEVADKLITYFKNNPKTISMTIACNDGWDEHYCECDVCKALGNTSDCVVNFANKVAKKVAEVYPERSLQIYSYHMTYQPPENYVALEPNVELMLCCETSMTRALDTDYYRNSKDSITRNTYTCSWRENAKEWIEKTSCKNVSVWKWYCIAAENANWSDVPWVQGNVASRDMDVWQELGVKYVYYDQGPLEGYHEDETSFEVRWPLWYVAAKLMWGTDMTGEELLQDACNKLFGNAANEMFAYYKKLADISENCTNYSMTWVPPTVKDIYKKHIDEINAVVEAAREASKNCTEDEIKRIENQLGYWEKTLAKLK